LLGSLLVAASHFLFPNTHSANFCFALREHTFLLFYPKLKTEQVFYLFFLFIDGKSKNICSQTKRRKNLFIDAKQYFSPAAVHALLKN
jgi:hypothetical protein